MQTQRMHTASPCSPSLVAQITTQCIYCLSVHLWCLNNPQPKGLWGDGLRSWGVAGETLSWNHRLGSTVQATWGRHWQFNSPHHGLYRLNLCVEHTVPFKKVWCFSGNKPWVTTELKSLLNEEKRSFRSGDKEELRRVQKELKTKIRKVRTTVGKRWKSNSNKTMQERDGED